MNEKNRIFLIEKKTTWYIYINAIIYLVSAPSQEFQCNKSLSIEFKVLVTKNNHTDRTSWYFWRFFDMGLFENWNLEL